MFKVFSFLKHAALIAVFGILAVFSSLSFSDNVIEKDRLANNPVWKTASSVIGTIASMASSLGRANLENKIPLSANIDVEAISKSFSGETESSDLSISGSLEEENAAWADFFAKIKEEWAKTKLK